MVCSPEHLRGDHRAGVGPLDHGPAVRHHLVVLGVKIDDGRLGGGLQVSRTTSRWAGAVPAGRKGDDLIAVLDEFWMTCPGTAW